MKEHITADYLSRKKPQWFLDKRRRERTIFSLALKTCVKEINYEGKKQ